MKAGYTSRLRVPQRHEIISKETLRGQLVTSMPLHNSAHVL